MKIISRHKWIFVILILSAVFLGFFIPMYRHDVKALTDFADSYQKFDRDISDFYTDSNGNLENQTMSDLLELNTKAGFRLSSLIKNEKELMNQARVIADMSGKEFIALKTYKVASLNKSASLDELTQSYHNLNSQRKSAYAVFKQLAETKD